MDGIVQNANETYALVKLPDGRTINMRIKNIKDDTSKGKQVQIETSIPPLAD